MADPYNTIDFDWDREEATKARVAALGTDGKLLTDSQGNPLMEKGFFIFKNSWGKGSFGVDNPHGDGYGYISYKYVAELNAYVSGLPKMSAGNLTVSIALMKDSVVRFGPAALAAVMKLSTAL